MENIITKKQSIIYISILIVMLFGDKETAITWVLIILVSGNIRRIPCKNAFLYFIRISGYFIVDSFPLFLCPNLRKIFVINPQVILWIIFAVMIGIIIRIRDLKEKKIVFSSFAVATLKHRKKSEIIIYIYGIFGAVFFEEVYFRGFLCNESNFFILRILISVFLFVISHYSLPWSNKFDKNDLFRQFYIGILNCMMLLLSRSIFPCIVLHFMCNLNSIIIEVLRYYRFYVNPEKYNNELQSDCLTIDF